ncbi:hypothetical protein IFM89_031083 [Coptis chinensis]|uniref:Hexosyltransferase n=1 Tax=Coptis chinensis TaxID=261450 RepID=A0A835INL4_9MAGN|nr:hypothetical protein IFM89_031083 [Coptis chinensis]
MFENFSWLNASYVPVMKQLQDSDTKKTTSLEVVMEKFSPPKKVVFLDDDVVVQKDLAPLFSIDLNGNENGAVETLARFGAGYTNVDPQMIEKGVVLHFNGNSKSWLKIGMESLPLDGVIVLGNNVPWMETLNRTNSLESRIRKATKEALKTTKLAGTICICQRRMAQ